MFSWRKAAPAAIRCLAASVNSGIRPFAGSVMIEVRYLPSIWKVPSPMSTKKAL